MLRPILLLLVAMCCIQVGASLGKSLFPLLGAEGTTALRLLLATVMLLALFRPWRHPLPLRRRSFWVYGLTLGLMNLFFYLALARVPMGIVVAIEFLGPLSVAIAASRRWLDGLWAFLAAAGLALLLPFTDGAARLDPIGVGYALLAGLGWAIYIVSGQKAGEGHDPASGGRLVASSMVLAALVTVPFGAGALAPAFTSWQVFGIGAVVALLSSALPYTIEMYALARLPARTFGILMSVEPALAALAGFIVLGERLTPLQCVAVGSVIVASVGSTLSARADALAQPVAN